MVEHVERPVAVANLNTKLPALPVVGDAHPQVVVVGAPQQPDVDPVTDATVQLMCGSWG